MSTVWDQVPQRETAAAPAEHTVAHTSDANLQLLDWGSFWGNFEYNFNHTG